MIKLNFAKKFSASVIAISAATMISTSAMAADIVDTAVQAGTFKTLAAALGAAGLVDTLKSPGPFTVFAPTDEAFAKLPAGTVEELLKPENKKKLVAILTYHVLPGEVETWRHDLSTHTQTWAQMTSSWLLRLPMRHETNRRGGLLR